MSSVPHPHQYLVLSVFSVLAILVSMCWYVIVTLICIFLMTKDDEHIFNCLSLFIDLFFGKVCVQLFDHFYWTVWFLVLELWECIIYSEYKAFVPTCIAHVFFQFSVTFSLSYSCLLKSSCFNFDKLQCISFYFSLTVSFFLSSVKQSLSARRLWRFSFIFC